MGYTIKYFCDECGEEIGPFVEHACPSDAPTVTEVANANQFHPSNPCNRPGCSIQHGIYPENEHSEMELSDEAFAKLAEVFRSITGKTLTRVKEEKP